MPIRSTQVRKLPLETFGAVLLGLMIESILDPDDPSQLRLHTWDGRKTATTTAASYRGCTYTPAPIAAGLTKAVCFASTSKPFASTARLTTSIRQFLCHYVALTPEAVDLLIAFVVASHFVDCLPVAPVLILLGPDYEASRVLRLLHCLCRRAILLGNVDIPALATLPSQLDATLLINQRDLPERVARILQASNDRNFCVARGNGQLNAFGAKAFSANPEFSNRIGMHLSLTPARDPLPALTEASAKEITTDFQAKLLRYRMVNLARVREAQLDVRDFVPPMRDEARAWLAPIRASPDLQESISSSLRRQSREAEEDRLSDDRCVIAEAALFFCHKANVEQFFVGELAERVNVLLMGRHEDRVLTDKMTGLLLRALGIHGQRVVKGYRILLADGAREQIHRVARAYQVPSAQDGFEGCRHCPGAKAN